MTYKLNIAIPDDLAAAVKAYAAEWGISISDAARVLLRHGLNVNQKPERA